MFIMRSTYRNGKQKKDTKSLLPLRKHILDGFSNSTFSLKTKNFKQTFIKRIKTMFNTLTTVLSVVLSYL